MPVIITGSDRPTVRLAEIANALPHNEDYERSGLIHSCEEARGLIRRIEVKAINPCEGEVIDPQPSQPAIDSSLRALKEVHRQPTAAEVSSLTFDKLRNARTRTQALSNQFARLLNRGSSSE